jgi:hypothetical protein
MDLIADSHVRRGENLSGQAAEQPNRLQLGEGLSIDQREPR